MNTKKRLIYIPLGGSGEIGMNMYAYGYGFPSAEEFILVDVGVTFPDMVSSPGVDLIMPDISFIEQIKERLLGIFITHAHEDHIGALGHLLGKMGAPVFCRKFSAHIATSKLKKVDNFNYDLRIIDIYPKKTVLGPFEVSFLPISHSIPEASSLIIDNPIGRLIHTGDFKLDESPVLGDRFDRHLLKKLKKPEVLALICDSTNVFSESLGRSESSLVNEITSLIEQQKGAVVATTFASNVARLLTLATCAQKAGRSVLVLGRAMQTMISNAATVGLLKNFPPTVSILEALSLPRSNLFILATGSQGEGRAVSAQLARDKYMDIILEDGDSFLFSSKTIPGNELAVSKVINLFMERGINVIDDQSGKYHVSGHANRPDLSNIHQTFNPKVILPMHGELRHLHEHKQLAVFNGFDSVVVPNGSVLDIRTDGEAKIVDQVAVGRMYYDGGSLVNASEGIIKSRLQMAARGHLAISLLFEKDSILENGIWVKSRGIPRNTDNDLDISQLIEEALEIELSMVSRNNLFDDSLIEGIVQRVCNKVCQKNIGKKPVTTIFINRVE